MGEPIVQLSEGKIKGFIGQNNNGKTIYKFLGIPYGKTPVVELRFKAPEPVESWEGIKDATKDGDASYNRDLIHETEGVIQGGEDCLVLNVFTRNINATDNYKPVMVYIHGGGFVVGCNKSDIYGPELLLTEDIVVVVINYRLGLLGFLHFDDESLDVPGNAGLKDQVLALKWVQRNIRAFGGDPNNVTIFGESAGSFAVHFHVLSPASKGLFHKAILQSGASLSSRALASPFISILNTTLGKKHATEKELLAILQTMTGKELFDLQEKIIAQMDGTWQPIQPVVEKPNKSTFLETDPFILIKKGEYNHVPVLIGYTSHEGLFLEPIKKIQPTTGQGFTYKTSIPWFLKPTDEELNEIVELLSNYYSKIPRSEDMLWMDSVLFTGIVASIVNHCKTAKCPIYVYRASADCKRNFFKHIHNIQAEGTCHADELGFLWNIKILPKIEENTLESLTSQRFVKFWTNFAATGNPTPSNDFGVTLSPVTDTNNITVLDIGNEVTVLQDLPERDRVELWKKIYNIFPTTENYL